MRKYNRYLLIILILYGLVCLVIITPITAWRSKYYKYNRKHSKQTGFKLRPDRENVLQPRIVGGQPVNWGEAPYYLRLEFTFRYMPFVCGACLMNYRGLRFAVTAAHCLWRGDENTTNIEAGTVKPKFVELVGADIDKDAYNPREQRFHADQVIIHQDYDPTTTANDIGLIFLKEYAYESLGLERVKGPGLDWDDPQFSTMVGHGAKFRLDSQRYLQKIELETYPRKPCNEGLIYIYGEQQALLDSQYCVSHPNLWVKQGVCYGDSGGPVVAFNYDIQRWYLAGIISFNSVLSCGTPGVFSVMTKVTHFVPWIKQYADIRIERFGTGDKYVNGKPDDSDL